MIKDVNVTIDLQKVVGNAGIWFPLIVFETATAENKGYTEFKLSDNPELLVSESALNTFVEKISEGNNPPEKIACFGVGKDETADNIVTALKKVEDYGWRQLILINFDDKESASTILNYAKSAKRMSYIPYCVMPADYDVKNNDYVVAVSGADTTDVATAITNIASVIGGVGGLSAGSYTYKNIIVNGASVMSNETYSQLISTSDMYPILAILEKAGDTVISDGQTVSGEYIDVIDSQDYIIQQIEYQTQKMLNTQNKIPYTNNGVAMLETVAISVLKNAYDNNMIADNADGSPAYSVSYGLREDATAENIQARKYIGGNFEFVLSGAIHNVAINGTIKYV